MPFFVLCNRKSVLHFCIVKNLLEESSMQTNLFTFTNRLRCCLMTLLLLGLWASLQAQGWERTVRQGNEDLFLSLTPMQDAGFVAVGSSDQDIKYARFDAEGVPMYQNRITHPGADQAYDVVATPDGGFVLAGSYSESVTTFKDIVLIKCDAFGRVVWQKTFGQPNNNEEAFALTLDSDGSLVLAGYAQNGPNEDVLLLKTDADGNFSNQRVYAFSGADDRALDILLTSGGDYLITGTTGSISSGEPFNLIYMLFDPALDPQWNNDKVFGGPENDEGRSLVELPNGNFLAIGKYGDVNRDIYWVEFDASGNLIRAEALSTPASEECTEVVLKSGSNNLYLVGYEEINAQETQVFVSEYTLNRTLVRKNLIGDPTRNEFARAASGLPDGGLMFAGETIRGLAQFESFGYIAKLGANQSSYFTNRVAGRVYFDQNKNCLDDSEVAANGWIVEAVQGGKSWYAATDANGSFLLPLEKGNYMVRLRSRSSVWAPCVAEYNINFQSGYETLIRNFALNSTANCPELEVDASTSNLKPCAPATYQVIWENLGNVDADNSRLEIILDKGLTYVSASRPLASRSDSLYVFDLGKISPRAIGRMSLQVNVGCNVPAGATHCVKAHIKPDQPCVPYSGPSLAVNAWCNNGVPTFTIENKGQAPMTQSRTAIIIEDVALRAVNPVILGPSEDTTFSYTGTGATYRLVVPQVGGHPGKSAPTVALEGCSTTGSTNTLGVYTQFEEDESDLFIANDCQENITPTVNTSRLRRGYPKGYSDSLYITAATEINYHLNFQNTGIDTAIMLVIRDTLAPGLDPATVRFGASSHAFIYEVYGEGILKITFPNILLPGSAQDDIRSRGFVKYRVSQKPGNPVGTVIRSRASAVFNFDPVSAYNATTHRIGGLNLRDFVTVSSFVPVLQGIQCEVFPNPVYEYANFKIVLPEGSITAGLEMVLLDLQGRVISRNQVNAGYTKVDFTGVAAGTYLFRLEQKGKALAHGQVVMMQ